MAENKLDRKDFFKKYNIENDALEKTGLEWNNLEAIYTDHSQNIPNLQPTANFIVESLRQVAEVHSLRIRIKEPEHLVEKLIRKKLENPELEITFDNYKDVVTDLIGVRALHLFKEDWNKIHDYVERTWELKEIPTANVRKGDPEEYTKQFTEKGCRINEHPFGYRSVHYLIKSQPSKEIFIAELQVRTIFEEGWSEIDHNVRYPYDLENVILAQVSAIHNRLAGSADEIGSFIKILKKELQERDGQYTKALEDQEKLFKELNEKIEALEITEAQKKDLEIRLKELSNNAMQNLFMPDINLITRAISNIALPALNPSFINTMKAIQAYREELQSRRETLLEQGTSSKNEEVKPENVVTTQKNKSVTPSSKKKVSKKSPKRKSKYLNK